MRYEEIIKVKEDATAGVTTSASIATIVGNPKESKRKQKEILLRRIQPLK